MSEIPTREIVVNSKEHSEMAMNIRFLFFDQTFSGLVGYWSYQEAGILL
jgi:hypothetical protein